MSQIQSNAFQPNTFLRYALLADAIASGATGLLLIVGAGLLESFTNIPVALAREAGLVLIPYVAFVATVGRAKTSCVAPYGRSSRPMPCGHWQASRCW
jgi:hypothetical protein